MSTFRLLPRPPELGDVAVAILGDLRALLPDAEVYEVGSTALPEMPGKQDLDVLVRVPETAFEATRARLDARFPRNPDQYSSSIYQGYCVPSHLDVAIQLTVAGGPHDGFLRFLDALRADPARAAAYAALKRVMDGQPMDAYRAAKAAFIEATLSRGAPVDAARRDP